MWNQQKLSFTKTEDSPLTMYQEQHNKNYNLVILNFFRIEMNHFVSDHEPFICTFKTYHLHNSLKVSRKEALLMHTVLLCDVKDDSKNNCILPRNESCKLGSR